MDVLIIIMTMVLAFELYFVHTDAKRQDNQNDNENEWPPSIPL